VPDLVLQPLQGFVRQWLVGLHESCMPALAEQGYDGIEVSSCISMLWSKASGWWYTKGYDGVEVSSCIALLWGKA
jgi:hypothetical protein